MTTFDEFLAKFKFTPEFALRFGIEREFFITNLYGRVVPRAFDVYTKLQAEWGDLFTYELSACQIESRTEIVSGEFLVVHLRECEAKLDCVLQELNLTKSYREVGPYDMPLDVFPDPSGRYARIAEGMPPEVRLAACQTTGTHVHIGMPDHVTALRVYNQVIRYTESLALLGDNSKGERLRIYRRVAPNCQPMPYESWEHFYREAVTQGFVEEPRNCWTLIRITKHGTIEFRMFGNTTSVEEIAEWAFRCRDLCLDAMT